MITTNLHLETEINEKLFIFICDRNATIGEIKGALCNMIAEVSNYEENIRKQEEMRKLATQNVEEKTSECSDQESESACESCCCEAEEMSP